jgi:hypothetical protein
LPLPPNKTYTMPEMLLKTQDVTCDLRRFFWPTQFLILLNLKELSACGCAQGG